MVIKYKVEVGFKDKYTKELRKENDVIDVTIERMKELNEKKKGRVIDIILDEEDNQSVSTQNNEAKEQDVKNKDTKIKYKQEDLQEMTVNGLKDLAEKLGCELTKAKKDEIIQEILEFQEK